MTKKQLQLIAEASVIRSINDLKMRDVDYDQSSADGLTTFEYDGQEIWDPFVDESMRAAVDPIDYYGEENIQKMVDSFYKAKG